MNDITIIITVILSVSTGILIGCVMTASRARQAYKLIKEIKDWADPKKWLDVSVGYSQARYDIRRKIEAFETEE